MNILRAVLATVVLSSVTIACAQVLENSEARFEFSPASGAFELVETLHKTASSPIAATYNGSSSHWNVRVHRRGNVNDFCVIDSTGVIDAEPSLTVSATVTRLWIQLGSDLKVRWRATIDFDGEIKNLLVTATWSLATGEPRLQGKLKTKWGGSTPPSTFYLSSTVFPVFEVDRFDRSGPNDHDWLVAPFGAGILVRRPTTDGFPDWWDSGTPSEAFAVHAVAYYDGASSRGVLLHSDDGDNEYKTLELATVADVGAVPGTVVMRLRGVPRDIFDSQEYEAPQNNCLTLFEGDWIDAADAHRDLLAANVPWHLPPVGSPANPMPQAAKDLVSEHFISQGENIADDGLDGLVRAAQDIARVLGGDYLTVWYGGYWPEEFDHFYVQDGVGYLPGRPSLGSAVREAQRFTDTPVALYVQSTLGEDYTDIMPTPPSPTPFQSAVFAAFVLKENGEIRDFCDATTGCPPRAGWMDPGTEFFRELLPETILTIAEFTGMEAVYLDYYLTSADYAIRDPLVDHLPGGGNYMYEGRAEQVALVQSGVAGLAGKPDLLFAMEGGFGRYSEFMHLMHRDIKEARATALQGGAVALSNAVSVPFFRCIYDNVKIGRIAREFTEPDVGRRSWIVGNDVMTYGQIMYEVNRLQDFRTSYAIRARIPHYEYLSEMARALREKGLRTWHNGTLRRLPALETTGVLPTGVAPGVNDGGNEFNDEYVVSDEFSTVWDGVLNVGMWRAPSDTAGADAGTLALAVGNPWVGDDGGDISFSAVFDPDDYPVWSSGMSTYAVEKHLNGVVTTVATGVTGTYSLMDAVVSGEVAYWVFRGS